MTQQPFQCGKCGGEWNRGFIVDYSDNSDFLVRWVEGEPVQLVRFGITGKNLDTAGRRQFGVRSMRCERCGFLELYAV